MRIVYIFCLTTFFLGASQEDGVLRPTKRQILSSQRHLVEALENNDLVAAEHALKYGAWLGEFEWKKAAGKKSEITRDLTAIFLAYRSVDSIPVEARWTPLACMTRTGNYEAVMLLLQARARVNVHYGLDDRTPLHEAVMLNLDEIIRALVNAHPDALLERDKEGEIPVHNAVRSIINTQLPIENVNKCIGTLFILLFYAQQHDRLSRVLSEKNAHDNTPRDIACKKGPHEDLERFLELCEQGDPEVINELIKVGAEFEHEVLIKELGTKKQNLTKLLMQRELTGNKIRY